MKIKWILWLILILNGQILKGQRVYEVSPHGSGITSLHGAINDIIQSNHNFNEDCEVILNEGMYYLDKPLVFDRKGISSAHKISIIAREGITPIISGGENISFYYCKDEEFYNKKKILEASMTHDIRNLWINNVRKKRADGFIGYASGIFNEIIDGTNVTGLLFPKENFPYFEDISGLEIIYFKNWRKYYFKVDAIYDNETITKLPDNLVCVSIKNFNKALEVTPKMIYTGPDNPYYFENAIEFLDEPGEWCFSPRDNKVYYLPDINENPENIYAIAPKLKHLISIKSQEPKNTVENLIFKGLDFSHTNWGWVSLNGFFPKQSSTYCPDPDTRSVIPAAIIIEDARNVKFQSCGFKNLGTNGIHIKNNVDNIHVDNNVFLDLSGTAICISDSKHRTYSDSILPVSNVNIINNKIEEIGEEYASCAGIEAYFCENLTIAHNELYKCPYTGISVGWGWTMEPTTQKNYKVLNNKIIGDIQKCSDGGGIYSLSNFGDEGLLIQGNFIDESINSSLIKGEGAIYTDEGSSNVKINNNVVITDRRWFYHHWAGSVEVDSVFVLAENLNNYGGINAPSGGTDIRYTGNGAHIYSLPHALADSIINNSGIQKEMNVPTKLDSLSDNVADDFDLVRTSDGFKIIHHNNDEDNIIKVNIYGIDGSLKKTYFDGNTQIVYADYLKGFHIIEVISNKRKKVIPLVL